MVFRFSWVKERRNGILRPKRQQKFSLGIFEFPKKLVFSYRRNDGRRIMEVKDA
jgi:hypothetical protein